MMKDIKINKLILKKIIESNKNIGGSSFLTLSNGKSNSF